MKDRVVRPNTTTWAQLCSARPRPRRNLKMLFVKALRDSRISTHNMRTCASLEMDELEYVQEFLNVVGIQPLAWHHLVLPLQRGVTILGVCG